MTDEYIRALAAENASVGCGMSAVRAMAEYFSAAKDRKAQTDGTESEDYGEAHIPQVREGDSRLPEA